MWDVLFPILFLLSVRRWLPATEVGARGRPGRVVTGGRGRNAVKAVAPDTAAAVLRPGPAPAPVQALRRPPPESASWVVTRAAARQPWT